MTEQEALKMAIAKKKCLENETSGQSELCDNNCDECELNYAQGNLGEQKEWLDVLINALSNMSRLRNQVNILKECSSKEFPTEVITSWAEQFLK